MLYKRVLSCTYRCVSICSMKDPKLLVPVRCTTRKFYLHKPPTGRNDWHVRFVPPAIDGVRRVVFRSTGTKEIGAAKRIAADRMRRGPFLSLDGLRRVSGVGPMLAKHLDSLVTFSGVYTQGASQDSTIRGRIRKPKRGGATRPAALRTRAPPPAPSRL